EQRPDSGPPLRKREDGQEPRLEHPRQAPPRRPDPGRRLRLAPGRRQARL
ncbi:MAG: Two-component transcriptional response regulator, LuxR family, partial [uncultured Rubrobacteraceae bacterium]